MRLQTVLSSTAVLMLAGCATVPQLGPEPAPRGVETFASTRALIALPGDWPALEWWQASGDPALNALMVEALSSSPDVAAAIARVRAAEALAGQAGAALLPRITADGAVGSTKQSQNLGIPPQFVPDAIKDTGRITGTFSFDLDLWGKNRAALAAATSQAEAARVDFEQARLMLTTGIASAYADLARYYGERDVAVDALKVRQATVDLTTQRVLVGVETRGGLRQAQSRVPAARADVTAIDEAIAITQHRIAALVGAGPDRGMLIGRPQMSAVMTGIPANAGIALIGRRPDIVAARLRAEAAAQRIKVARADFYPDISLSAIIGLQSLGLGKIFELSSSYGNGGAAFTLPIFDGGQIAGRYRGARAEYDIAVANYNSILITALRETADAVSSSVAAATQLADLRRGLALAEEARVIANLRYQGGLSNQLSVLIADDAVLANRRAVADQDARRHSIDFALIRALGGGYRQTQNTGTK
jgi:NodT family efflux transporter outer membrane factor (OMF) lipoprotein